VQIDALKTKLTDNKKIQVMKIKLHEKYQSADARLEKVRQEMI